MSDKIAVVVVGPCSGHKYHSEAIPNDPNHYRYTLFEYKTRTGKTDWSGKPEFNTHSNIVLTYDDGYSIEDFLRDSTVEFSVNRGVNSGKSQCTGDETLTFMHVHATVTSSDRIIAHYLGDFDGHKCYAVYKQSYQIVNVSLGRHFLKRVPKFGRSSVVYAPQIARNSFSGPNITQTQIDPAQDRVSLLSIFDWMDERIAPIMAPMVALLPEVK